MDKTTILESNHPNKRDIDPLLYRHRHRNIYMICDEKLEEMEEKVVKLKEIVAARQ